MLLIDFLAQYTTATQDTDQSRPDIHYAVYHESQFMYEFLDEELFAIRYVLPRSKASAADEIARYETAFGPPTDTTIPADFRRLGATKFFSWDLSEHNLRVNFAYLRSQFGDVDLDLFGQFINREAAKEYLARAEQPVRRSSRRRAARSSEKPSTTGRAIESEIADPVWGRVAAKINGLCAGQISDEEIHVHILKTVKLARDGGFSPEFTLRALQDGEATAARLRLSPVTVVTTCQQSLAYAGVAADPNP